MVGHAVQHARLHARARGEQALELGDLPVDLLAQAVEAHQDRGAALAPAEGQRIDIFGGPVS